MTEAKGISEYDKQEVDRLSFEQAAQTVQERGGVCPTRQGPDSVALLLDDPNYVRGLTYQVTLDIPSALRLYAQLAFLLAPGALEACAYCRKRCANPACEDCVEEIAAGRKLMESPRG